MWGVAGLEGKVVFAVSAEDLENVGLLGELADFFQVLRLVDNVAVLLVTECLCLYVSRVSPSK